MINLFEFFPVFEPPQKTKQKMKNKTRTIPLDNGIVDSDDDQPYLASIALDRTEFDVNIEHTAQSITRPTTTTTTTLATSTLKLKNCRRLIEKRAHTLDDFMEGKNYSHNTRLHTKMHQKSYSSSTDRHTYVDS